MALTPPNQSSQLDQPLHHSNHIDHRTDARAQPVESNPPSVSTNASITESLCEPQKQHPEENHDRVVAGVSRRPTQQKKKQQNLQPVKVQLHFTNQYGNQPIQFPSVYTPQGSPSPAFDKKSDKGVRNTGHGDHHNNHDMDEHAVTMSSANTIMTFTSTTSPSERGDTPDNENEEEAEEPVLAVRRKKSTKKKIMGHRRK